MSNTPAPIREHLSRQNTNVRTAHARIEQVFYPGEGWLDIRDGRGYDRHTWRAAIIAFITRGATHIAIGYDKPHQGGRVRADFSLRELVA